MHILYLHGLDGSLSVEKRTILEEYGTVYAPSIAYRHNPNIIEQLLTTYTDHDPEIDVVIGSSMGGFAAYYVSDVLNQPALLFNPALAYRSVEQEVPQNIPDSLNFKYIVVGGKDEVIDPDSTVAFLKNSSLSSSPKYHLDIRFQLGHRIPVDYFEEVVEAFFLELYQLES